MAENRAGYALIELQQSGPVAYKSFPADMWGVFILIAVEDLSSLLSCKMTCRSFCRLIFGFSGMALNLWLQGVILWYVNKYIVGEAVHSTQSNYRQYHAEVFNSDATFNETKWHSWDGPYIELCNLAMSKAKFTMAVVFMWIARMLGEMRDTYRLSRDMWNIAPLGNKPFEDQVVDKRDEEGGDHYYLVAFSSMGRVFVFTLVIIPKVLVTLVLTFIGCRWLCATESFSDLILNALALEFVIGIDEIVYGNFAPQQLSDWVENAKIAHAASADADTSAVWAYIRSFLTMYLCMALSYFYLMYLQQVIPEFPHDIQAHCGGWFDGYYEPVCPFGELDPINDCFPYGK